MGAQLVSLALTRWAPHLPDRAFRVLIRMALTALDEPTPDRPANLYYGGRDLLTSALYDGRNATQESAYRTVKYAVKELIEVGAIRRSNKAKAGANQEYELTLWAPIRIDTPLVDKSAAQKSGGTGHVPTGGTPDVPTGGTPDVPDGGTGDAPQGTTQEPLQEPVEEQGVDLGVVVTDAHATDTPKPQDESPAPKCPHPGCAKGYVVIGTAIAHCPECQPPPSNVIPFPDRRSP